MSYLLDKCTFEPVTDELLARLNDFVCLHETDISDFFKTKAVKSAYDSHRPNFRELTIGLKYTKL